MVLADIECIGSVDTACPNCGLLISWQCEIEDDVCDDGQDCYCPGCKDEFEIKCPVCADEDEESENSLYKEKLLYFMEGLEMENVERAILLPKEELKELGTLMAQMIRDK